MLLYPANSVSVDPGGTIGSRGTMIYWKEGLEKLCPSHLRKYINVTDSFVFVRSSIQQRQQCQLCRSLVHGCQQFCVVYCQGMQFAKKCQRAARRGRTAWMVDTYLNSFYLFNIAIAI
jgi:hypothetical protein